MTADRVSSGVLITGAEVAACWRALAWAIHRARADGRPVSGRALALEKVLREEASAPGQRPAQLSIALEPLPQDLISSEEAAVKLGVTSRTVRRNAVEFGGRLIGGRWLFDPFIIAATALEERQKS